MRDTTDPDGTLDSEAAQFWDGRYRDYHGTWGERVNPLLVEVAGPLSPGRALDLGCGTGGDTFWLARRGWQVTGVDIAATAVNEIRRRALELGLAERVRIEQHDLSRSFPSGRFDLVSAQYLHTPYSLDRRGLLRTAAHALCPGGLLLVVDHGSIAPWSWNQDPDTHFPTPAEILAELGLDPGRWSPERTDMPRRQATGPGGETALVTDNVLLVRRVSD